MAQEYVTGAPLVFVGLGVNLSPVYLGCGDGEGPRITPSRYWHKVHTDFSGKQMAHDRAFQGEEHTISMTLIRFNNNVISVLQDNLGPTQAVAAGRGTIWPADMGALLVEQGLGWPMWIYYPYNVLTPFRNPISGAMEQGQHYFCCTLTAPENWRSGVTPRGLQITVQAQNVFVPGLVRNGVRGGFVCYDNNCAPVANLPIN